MKNLTLVLGATGTIGRELVQDLKARNANFLGGVPPGELEYLSRHGIRGVALDFDDAPSLDRAMRGVDRLFMLVPLHERMGQWGETIVSAARRNGISFILRSSMLDADPDSNYHLCRVHGEIDRRVRDSGIPFSILHPNFFMQNFATFYRDQIVNDERLFYPGNHAKLSAVDVSDIAACAAEILTRPGDHLDRDYELTGPQALTFQRMTDILSAVSGREIEYTPVSDARYEDGLVAAGLSPWHVDMMMSVEKNIRDGRAERVTDDVKRITGREAHTFMQFARRSAPTWERTVASVL